MKKLSLPAQIILAMIFGLLIGFLFKNLELKWVVADWIAPFGKIFINLLKMIAVPLIVVSIIVGLADLKDIAKVSALGKKTIGLYLLTTFSAVTIGLVLANVIQPGNFIKEESRVALLESFSKDANQKIELAVKTKESGPLQPLVDIVPDNFFAALTDNSKMLQVILFVILIGIGIISVKEDKVKPVVDFFKGLNEIIMKIIDIIMLAAPIGVFALMASLMVEIPDYSTLSALLVYAFTVVLGLAILVFGFYPLLIKVIGKTSPKRVFQNILPAQLLAFSTSSSAATLPVTMERVVEHVGVDEEVASFVLPLGATVNMDGTSLYQAVAAIFIAQAMGLSLDLSTQLMIILTATLASIGSAAVPSAGMVMLVIVLGQAGIPEAGLALIFAIDRPLDMCRTVVNVTSDATVATIIASTEGKLHDVNR
ncbi:MAG: dicarboxylate/amino acid:cation symporter [Flavobacteriales bacterium]|nr:dicarboxylate/amino acid:cation symporter [Flavobacteriales bacterium]